MKTIKEKDIQRVVEPQEINSLKEAIAYIGESDKDVKDYHKTVNAGITGHFLRYIELVIIIKAVNKLANGGRLWLPDWDNDNEKKWWVYWNMKPSGFGVSGTTYVTWAYGYGLRLSPSIFFKTCCFVLFQTIQKGMGELYFAEKVK